MTQTLTATAILLTLNDFIKGQQNFSAHDVTRALRDKVNTGSIEFSDAQKEDVDGVITYRVAHEKVRETVNDLYNAGLLAPYSREYVSGTQGGYRRFTYQGVSPSPQVSPSPVLSLGDTLKALMQSSTTPSTSLGINAEVESKVKTYVENKHSVGENPTLKQIQSRLKGYDVLCSDIKEIVKNLGFVLRGNLNAESLCQVLPRI